MPKLRQKQRTARATNERPCPECAAPIKIGDLTQAMKLPDGRRAWKHADCRGRLEHHLGLNDKAYAPSPKGWNAPPTCPECGAYMTRSQGGAICQLSERHASRSPVQLEL